MALFETITAQHWRESFARSRAYRNTIADRIKHMSTQDGWIKMSERAPTLADMPVWCIHKGMSVFLKTAEDYEDYFVRGCARGWVDFWRPAAADIPAPPKEPTQTERDGNAYGAWTHTDQYLRSQKWEDVWHAALAYERAEVAKLLPVVGGMWSETRQGVCIEAIRARCAGGGA